MNVCAIQAFNGYLLGMADRENHRQRLLDGALRCLQEKGYAATTARDIAAAANANLGSIGYHFNSKDALLSEAICEGFRAWTELIARRLFALPDVGALERLRLGFDLMLDSFEEHRHLLLAFVEALAPAARSPELRERLAEQYEDARNGWAAMIRLAFESSEGSRSPDSLPSDAEVDALASLLIAVADGLVIQWFLDPDRMPTTDVATRAVTVAVNATIKGSS